LRFVFNLSIAKIIETIGEIFDFQGCVQNIMNERAYFHATILAQFLISIYLSNTSIATDAVQLNFNRSEALAAKPTNASERSSIGGIRLKMTEQQVQKMLGKPHDRIVGYECGNDEIVNLNYRDIKVKLYNDGGKFLVIRVETNNRKYLTNRGIRVGNSIDRAQATDPSLILNEYAQTPLWRSFNAQFDMHTNDRGKITKLVLGIETGC
jgi:hypothetical protein